MNKMFVSPGDYGKSSIALHWLMALLIAAAYAFIELRELYPKGSDPREAMKTIHFGLGLCVLFLLLPRLAARINGGVPAITPESPFWQQVAARVAHLALYAFMLVMPILGWLILSAAGKPIPFFGLNLPALIAEDKALAKTLKGIHETVGEFGYYLIALHVFASLYHHYFQHDDTLLRMSPFKRRDSSDLS
jgi:cytochrome b561